MFSVGMNVLMAFGTGQHCVHPYIWSLKNECFCLCLFSTLYSNTEKSGLRRFFTSWEVQTLRIGSHWKFFSYTITDLFTLENHYLIRGNLQTKEHELPLTTLLAYDKIFLYNIVNDSKYVPLSCKQTKTDFKHQAG